MTRYATSTPEARELVAELSFVWDQIKNLSPQQSSSSEEEPTSSRSRGGVRRVVSRGDGLLEELEPRSHDSRDWEGAVFSDGEEQLPSETRNDRRKFKRRVNRAIEALRADVAALREELDVLRSRPLRTGQRDGILVTLGKWIMRFVGVPPLPLEIASGLYYFSFFFAMHCLTYLSHFWYGHIYIVAATTEHDYGDASSQNGFEEDYRQYQEPPRPRP